MIRRRNRAKSCAILAARSESVFTFEYPLSKPILTNMRRVFILAGVLAGLSLLRLPAPGQDATAATNAAATTPATDSAATNAAAVAAAQGVDEKFKQLAADIDSLRAADESLRDKLSSLHDDMQQIRAEQARLASNAISPDDLKPLALKIEEVDKKRMDDKAVIADEVKQTAIRLERLITDTAAAPAKPTANPPAADVTAAAANGYAYTIGSGDTLSAIVNSYNAKFKEKGMKTITWKQAEEANPTVNWNRLKVGQVIVIPRPPE
jgi:TolA-binding protein